MAIMNDGVRDRANESAKRAKQMSTGVQYAITTCLQNISNGAFWGFTTLDGVKKHADSIREASPKIIARKLGNACLIEVEPEFLISSIIKIDPNILTNKDVADINQAKAEAHMAFERFLIARGKAQAKEGKAYEGVIGIYCTNDVTTIASKGISYPAFRLSIGDVLQYLSRYGYMIKCGGQYVTPNAASGNPQLFESMQLSPTKTGIFTSIKCCCSPEQMKAMEKQFKARTGQVKATK